MVDSNVDYSKTVEANIEYYTASVCVHQLLIPHIWIQSADTGHPHPVLISSHGNPTYTTPCKQQGPLLPHQCTSVHYVLPLCFPLYLPCTLHLFSGFKDSTLTLNRTRYLIWLKLNYVPWNPLVRRQK